MEIVEIGEKKKKKKKASNTQKRRITRGGIQAIEMNERKENLSETLKQSQISTLLLVIFDKERK